MYWKLLRRLLPYAAVILLLWYSTRGIRFSQTLRSLQRADLSLFVGVSLAGFLVWFFGETLLFSRLFSYFHKRTEVFELVPAIAAFYFLQIINLTVASSALMFFLNKHKGATWSAAGVTLLFQGLLDVTLLGALALAAIFLGLDPPLHEVAPYAVIILLVGTTTAGSFLWLRPKSGLLKWLYERPALTAFRMARPRHYMSLVLIRLPIFIADGFILFGELRSFHVDISLFQTLLFTPAVLLLGSLPFAPVGLGTLQFLFVKGLAGFAPRADLLAAALAISFINLVWRMPLGFVSIGLSNRDRLSAEGYRAAVSL
ncbi:MAG: flippase-like domain-containing protein [Candidatus Binataceae bacterium]|nr:flippase-like domain-containing protein [Candidatus Binataceae bacterium]